MKLVSAKAAFITVAGVFAVATIISTAWSQAAKGPDPKDIEKAVRARLAEIQDAAQGLDPDKVFGFVLENDTGSLVQNGRLFLTRKEALESTRQGFRGLEKVDYRFNQEHVTLLSSTVALAVGEGMSSATTQDGRTFTRPFAQSVILILTNAEWKVFHAHRSFPPAK
jgi:SnoaL-like domain